MNTATKLMTVEEGRGSAEAHPDRKSELHNGQLVEMTQRKLDHQNIQRRLFLLLFPMLRQFGDVYPECANRGTPEYDSPSADVGMIWAERYRPAKELNEFFGAPDLVIEILSPSNRPGEMRDRQAFCFAHGTQSFWMVDPKRRTVQGTTVSGQTETYTEGDHIPLEPFTADSLPVTDIFS